MGRLSAQKRGPRHDMREPGRLLGGTIAFRPQGGTSPFKEEIGRWWGHLR